MVSGHGEGKVGINSQIKKRHKFKQTSKKSVLKVTTTRKSDRTCKLVRSLLLWSPDIGYWMLMVIVEKTYRAKAFTSGL